MRSTYRGSRQRAGLSVGLVILGLVVLAVTPVHAGIGGTATPTWPGTATVGDLFSASVQIINTSTTPNETESVNLTTLFVTPACASGATAVCLPADADPGVFKVLSAVGDASTTPCGGVSFTVGAPNPVTGEVSLTPTSTVTLGPSTGPAASRTCLVNLSLRVFSMPTNPAVPGTGTTDPLSRGTLVGQVSGLSGAASGAAQITVSKATPGLSTAANPTGTIVPGTSVADTATVPKAPGAVPPTGSVRFLLCQPNEVNANGCPSPAGTKIGADVPLSGNSATSASTSNTTTPGTYCWRARYLGDANYNPVNHTDAVAECFTVAKLPSTTATLATRTGGNVLPGSAGPDAATVSGVAGQPTPTGTVAFFLCQPNEITVGQGCVAPAGTQIGSAKTLSNGQATSDAASGASTATPGKHCWRAEYSGDGFYLPSSHSDNTSECFNPARQPSSTTTLSSQTGANVPPGTSVTDTATVSGGAGQPTPTGTVTFFLCQPNEVTAGGCVTGGTAIGAAKSLVNGQATSDGTTNTTVSGKYCWRAEYSGDGVYTASSHTDATDECFSVLAFRITVIVCTAEATPRFHSSNVTFGATTTASCADPPCTDLNALCTADANFNNLDAGTNIPITVTIP